MAGPAGSSATAGLDARAMLAAGMTLDEIPYWREGTLDKYTPSGDYVVVKFARWAFEKFRGIEDKLGTQMRAVGEVMSIGKNYKEAFLKANPEWEADMLTITCKDGRIQEARLCLSKSLDPVPCGRDVIRDCTLPDALFEPVR